MLSFSGAEASPIMMAYALFIGEDRRSFSCPPYHRAYMLSGSSHHEVRLGGKGMVAPDILHASCLCRLLLCFPALDGASPHWDLQLQLHVPSVALRACQLGELQMLS